MPCATTQSVFGPFPTTSTTIINCCPCRPSTKGNATLNMKRPLLASSTMVLVSLPIQLSLGFRPHFVGRTKATTTTPWHKPSFDRPTTVLASAAASYYSNTTLRRTDIELPLLYDVDDELLLPLPCDHLPRELATVHGLQLVRPTHQRVIQLAMEAAADDNSRLFGHVATTTTDSSLVGAIGCAAQVLFVTTEDNNEKTKTAETLQPVQTVICSGTFRFIVKSIKTTFPFPVAIVDELIDDTDEEAFVAPNTDDTLSDNVIKDASYADLDTSELVQRTLLAMKQCIDQKLEQLPKKLTPLELSILKDTNGMSALAADQHATEEMAANFEIFAGSLVDICPLPNDRYYAIGMLAAELVLENSIRRQCLLLTNGLQRLRLVLQRLEEQNKKTQAVDKVSIIPSEQDLQVGEPTLPLWARQIRKGMRVEYYWNDEYEWCAGQVVEDPILIVNELILTIYFPSDGTTHRLPLTAEEKVRWRPAG
jgi:hypothetical protein